MNGNEEFIKQLSKQLENPNLTHQKRKKLLKLMEQLLFFYQIKEPIGIIADTHIGNKKENMEYIKRTYDYFFQCHIQSVFHLGDLFDGLCNFENVTDMEQRREICEKQWNRFVREYPKGFQNYVVLGNHDVTMHEVGIPLRERLQDLPDFLPLGCGKGYMKWYNQKLFLMHPVLNGEKIPNGIQYDLYLKGHSHEFSFMKNKQKFKIPTLSDNFPRGVCSISDLPGFLLFENQENKMVFHYSIFQDGGIKHVLKKERIF